MWRRYHGNQKRQERVSNVRLEQRPTSWVTVTFMLLCFSSWSFSFRRCNFALWSSISSASFFLFLSFEANKEDIRNIPSWFYGQFSRGGRYFTREGFSIYRSLHALCDIRGIFHATGQLKRFCTIKSAGEKKFQWSKLNVQIFLFHLCVFVRCVKSIDRSIEWKTQAVFRFINRVGKILVQTIIKSIVLIINGEQMNKLFLN